MLPPEKQSCVQIVSDDAPAGSWIRVHAGTLAVDRPTRLGCMDMALESTGSCSQMELDGCRSVVSMGQPCTSPKGYSILTVVPTSGPLGPLCSSSVCSGAPPTALSCWWALGFPWHHRRVSVLHLISSLPERTVCPQYCRSVIKHNNRTNYMVYHFGAQKQIMSTLLSN